MTMEKLVEYNDQLLGLPSGVLTFFFCIGFGYAVKASHHIPNKWMPAVLMAVGILMFTWGAPSRSEDLEIRIWLFRNFCVGTIIGCVAWLTHKSVLKHVDRKLGWLNGSDDTEHFKKPPL